jgi:hypothetical protein
MDEILWLLFIWRYHKTALLFISQTDGLWTCRACDSSRPPSHTEKGKSRSEPVKSGRTWFLSGLPNMLRTRYAPTLQTAEPTLSFFLSPFNPRTTSSRPVLRRRASPSSGGSTAQLQTHARTASRPSAGYPRRASPSPTAYRRGGRLVDIPCPATPHPGFSEASKQLPSSRSLGLLSRNSLQDWDASAHVLRYSTAADYPYSRIVVL